MSEAASIAYEQADRALREQAAVLDDVRRRAGFIAAAASGVATFLGGVALAAHVSPSWVNVFAAIPLLLFAAGLVQAISVVLPTNEPAGAFRFAASADSILDLGERSPSDVREQVARGLEGMWDGNKPFIDVYMGKLRMAAYLLSTQVLAWSALLVAKEMA